MTSNVSKPDISPDFTIEDIHKIREWNHERRKGMNKQEVIDDIKNGAREFEALIEAARLEAAPASMQQAWHGGKYSPAMT